MKNINKKLFLNTLSKFTTGVAIIGINIGNKNIGKTVNSFSSLSLKPPLVLFSLDKKSSSLNKFKKNKFVSINILCSKQKNISVLFSKKKSTWPANLSDYGKFNTPLIKNCLSNLECKIIKLISQGDHIIFICQILTASNNAKLKPLIYYNSKYYK